MAKASRHLACGRVFRAVVASAGKPPLPQRKFSVMTYNILAEKYTQGGWHSYCPSSHLRWDSRKERLFEEIESYSSDIICLQEVEAGVFAEELQPWLAERGYQGHYLARQYGENVQSPPEGVALFYLSDVFELLHLRTCTFSATTTDPPAPLASALLPSDAEDAEAPAAALPALPYGSVDGDAEDAAMGEEEVAEVAAAAAASQFSGGSSNSNNASANSSSSSIDGDVRSKARRSATGKRARTRAATATAPAAPVAAAGAAEPALPGEPLGQEGPSTSGRRGGGNNEFWSVFSRRKEGAILALLRHRPSSREVLAAVTHLFWNPAFPDVKAFQAAALCREMSSFLRQHCGVAAEGVPVVLAGDFNSLHRKRVPDVFDPKIPRGADGLVSGVYALLTRGSLPPDHPDHPATRRRPGETGNPDFRDVHLTTSGLRLASAYQLAHGRDPPLTTRTATFAGCLDYIFVSPQHLEVTRTLEMPYDYPRLSYEAMRDPLADVEFSPIPDAVYPSDHLSLAALLRFKG